MFPSLLNHAHAPCLPHSLSSSFLARCVDQTILVAWPAVDMGQASLCPGAPIERFTDSAAAIDLTRGTFELQRMVHLSVYLVYFIGYSYFPYCNRFDLLAFLIRSPNIAQVL